MQQPEPASTPWRSDSAGNVTVKSAAEQDAMRVAGRLAAEVLDMIGEHVVPGVSTEELDRICHEYIVDTHRPSRRRSAIAAFRNRSALRSTTSSATASRAIAA